MGLGLIVGDICKEYIRAPQFVKRDHVTTRSPKPQTHRPKPKKIVSIIHGWLSKLWSLFGYPKY